MDAGPSETDVVEYEITVAAEPETVFAFFTDPARMVQWMGAEAVLDPRPGGICRIVIPPTRPMRRYLEAAFGRYPEPDAGGVMMGRFVAVEPPRRVAFTWGWERELYALPPQSTAVEVSFTPDEAGTILHLVHRRLPAGAIDFHRAGWQHYLSRLAAVAACPSREAPCPKRALAGRLTRRLRAWPYVTPPRTG